jgi:hypothetical protein
MKFTTAWAKTAAQNVTLKVATVILGIVTVFQLSVITGLSMKEPLIIERSCYSKVLTAKPADPTQEEIKSFLSEALPMRFDSTGYLKDGFLAIEETIARDKELATLKSRQMNQRVLISEIKFDGKDIQVFTDRLVSIGKIKSALTLNLKVKVEQTNRSESNPYGLIVSSISQIEEKEDKK